MAELGVLIPILGIMCGMLAVWTKHQRQMAELRLNSGSDQQSAHQGGRIDELEDRLRVLERIVTDRGYDVATQIEALRDARRIDAQLDTPERKERV